MLQIANTLSDWLLAAAATIGSGLVGLGRVVVGNRKRSRENKRRLEGDDANPNNQGVLEALAETQGEVENTREELHEFRRETRDAHREVMERIDELDPAAESETAGD